jgi:hypothetical protein
MLALILRYGIIAGLIVTLPMDVSMLRLKAGDPEPGLLVGYLTMLVGLTAVFLGIKHYRDKVLAGTIGFKNAFMLGLGISAVAGLIYAIGWEISLNFMSFDFTEAYARSVVESARAHGATGAALEKAVADAQSFTTMYRNPLLRFPMTFLEMFPVGMLVSLVSAALLRKPQFLPAKR